VQATLKPSDFDGQPLIMYARQGAGYFHQMLLNLFTEAHAEPQFVQHVTQIHSMLGLVRAGLAAAIVPQSATGLFMQDIQFRMIDTTPEAPVELWMAWRRNNANPALVPMRQLCTEVLA
jgi:DNA-binding transcriptional LysR family regulator